jgi:hypothetical protein
MKAGMIEPEETAVARQRLGKHVPAETNIYSKKVWGNRHTASGPYKTFSFFQTKENMLKLVFQLS